MNTKRCMGCDEPEFMCCCSTEFQGEEVVEIYHQGVFTGGKQVLQVIFKLAILPTVIINKLAFSMRCPDRYFMTNGGNALEGAR